LENMAGGREKKMKKKKGLLPVSPVERTEVAGVEFFMNG